MAAAPLPAARQITRPFGAGRRCADSTTSGWALATAASKIARSRGRRSVMISPRAIGSVAEFAADDVAEQLPAVALELHQLQLFDRLEIVGTGGQRDARQQAALRE